MPRKRGTKKPRMLDVLPSLTISIPVVRLERIENIYPVFEDRTICLKRDRIPAKRAFTLQKQEVETKNNIARIDDSDDDINQDALFEYEVDLENLSQGVRIKTEIIKDESEDPVVVVNLVPEVRAVIERKEDKVTVITSATLDNSSVLPDASADIEQDMKLQTYTQEDEITVITSCTNDSSSILPDASADIEQDMNLQTYTQEDEITVITSTADSNSVLPDANADVEQDGNLQMYTEDAEITVITSTAESSSVLPDASADVEQDPNLQMYTQEEQATPSTADNDAECVDIEQSSEDLNLHAYSLANGVLEDGETNIEWGSENQSSNSNDYDDDDDVIILSDSMEPSDKNIQGSSKLSTSWTMAKGAFSEPHAPETSSKEEVEEMECLDNAAVQKRNYECSKCKKSYVTERGFTAHDCSESKSDTRLEGFLCPWCEGEFLSLKELKQHAKICWKGMLTCIICSATLSGKLGIINHLQAHKKESSQFETREKACLVCGLFDDKWNLVEHWRIHTGVNLLRCMVCKEIMNLNNLLYHLNHHRQNDAGCSELCWCQSCGLTFMNKHAYTNHRNSHSNKKYTFLCECCGLFFESMKNLEQHILYHVDHNSVYKCTLCKKIYPFRAHFDIHCKSCFNLNEIKWDSTPVKAQSFLKAIAEKYLKVFNTHTLDLIQYSLKKGPVRSTPKEPPLMQCKGSKDNGFVLMRLRKEDDTVLLYSCQVCHRRLVGRDSFMRHWRIHTGYNPNKCLICNEIFPLSSLLETHMSVAHSSNFSKCSACSLIFRTALENKYHTLAHIKKSVYFCEVCGAGFYKFNYLEYHVFTNHVKECEIRNSQLNAKPTVNRSVSTEQGTVNGGTSATQSSGSQSSSSSSSSSTNSTAAVNTSTIAASGSALNSYEMVMCNSKSCNSSSNSTNNQVNPATNAAVPETSVALQQTNKTVVSDLYMCTICKTASPDLSVIVQHIKSHKT